MTGKAAHRGGFFVRAQSVNVAPPLGQPRLASPNFVSVKLRDKIKIWSVHLLYGNTS